MSDNYLHKFMIGAQHEKSAGTGNKEAEKHQQEIEFSSESSILIILHYLKYIFSLKD